MKRNKHFMFRIFIFRLFSFIWFQQLDEESKPSANISIRSDFCWQPYRVVGFEAARSHNLVFYTCWIKRK